MNAINQVKFKKNKKLLLVCKPRRELKNHSYSRCRGWDGVGCETDALTREGAKELFIVQELCESRGGRPELSVLTSLLVSVDVKNY